MKIKHISRIASGYLVLAAMAAVPTFAQVTPVPPTPGQAAPIPMDAIPTQTVEGTVDGFNRDPRGRVNSVVIKVSDGELAQFNLPPDFGDVATHLAVEGQKATAAGSPERTVGDRTIFRLTQLTAADGKSTITVPTPGVPEPTQTVEGTVKRLNFTDRGEVDGALLESGDYVHTGPEAATGLTTGGKLSVVGFLHPMVDGHQAIEATTVNGRAIPRPAVPAGPRPRPEAGVVPPTVPGTAPVPPVPATPPAPDIAQPIAPR